MICATCRRVRERGDLAGAGGRDGPARHHALLARSSFTITRRSRPKARAHLFDGTEIDEILSLRIMTLTDQEKLEMGRTRRTGPPDPRADRVHAA